jgi:hypothetical protein
MVVVGGSLARFWLVVHIFEDRSSSYLLREVLLCWGGIPNGVLVRGDLSCQGFSGLCLYIFGGGGVSPRGVLQSRADTEIGLCAV